MNIRVILLAVAVGTFESGCKKEDASPDRGEKKTEGITQANAAENEGQKQKQAHGERGTEEEGGGHGQAGHEEVVALTPEAAKAAQIKLVKVERRSLSQGLTAVARISFTQKGVAKVAARVPGRLTAIEVQLGQRVKKGQVLGQLESPELGRARADYTAAAAKARVAEANFKREKDLQGKGISSEREMREAEGVFAAARAEMNAADGRLHALGLSEADIGALKDDEHYASRFAERSPIDGTVVEISASIGQSVEPTAPLFTVGDLSRLWVLLDIYEAQLPSVQIGQRVDVTVPAIPNRRFQGNIEYIGDVVEEKTRTVAVRVAVPNGDGLLKPGMFAQAEINTGQQSGASSEQTPHLVIPREAVQKVGEDQVVFVADGQNRFKAVKIKVGTTSANEAELIGGLKEGAEVVAQGAFILKSELSKESMGGD
jgi:cobalt-zinc-cadmium efflux system membrane fusion protein